MAARQDQTLQIALILFAILLVVFAGFTYYFYKQNSDSLQQIASIQKDISEEKRRANNLQAENEAQRGFLGIDQFAEAKEVEAQFIKDMALMGATLPEPRRKYRDALTQVFQEKEAVVAAQAVDKMTIKTLETKLQEVEAGHQAQISRLNEQITKIEQQAATARNEFSQARQELDTNKKSLAEQIAKQTDQFDKERQQMVDQVANLNGDVQKLQRTIEKCLEERRRQEPGLEVADGRIIWVNQANSTVWINLGSADSLRRQVTFSVHDTDENDAGKAEVKGSVEVVRMLSNHMAECRVTDDDPRNPILPGDFIYSQIWHAGRPQHFALTGIIDLDGDGQSDLQLAKELIALNGGVVDAAPGKEGQVVGKMSLDTRYLVLGEFPESQAKAALRDTWSKMGDEAKSLGVEKITLTDFMSQMGYKPEDRTVPLGQGIRSDDFRPRPSPKRGDLRPRSPYTRP